MNNIATNLGLQWFANKAPTSCLAKGNSALRSGDYAAAATYYLQALQQTPDLRGIVAGNLKITQRKFHAERKNIGRKRVAVCGWELAHNAAGRVYTLAQLYQTFSDVEIIGTIFPKWGRELWEPIRDTDIPVHSFVVDDESRFLEQAIELVVSHPYDIVHLSKPRIPNIFFGLLYKLIWDAKVLMDIDDEELAFVKAESPISVDDYIKQKGRLPDLNNLASSDWTRIAVGLAKEFDGITVANPALQQRYGGDIIRHARNEKLFQPSIELKQSSRRKYGIATGKKVVLFFGTPREHKGLLETAEAISVSGSKDVVFVVAGGFPDAALKQKLQETKGVEYLFLGPQSFRDVPEVVALGDICVLLQQPELLVSQFQIPAKLSDALAMGKIVILQDLPSTADVIWSDAVIPVKDKTALAQELKKNLSQSPSDQSNLKALALFIKEFSFAANIPRLHQTLQTAQATLKSLDNLLPLLWSLDALAFCRPLVMSEHMKKPDTGHKPLAPHCGVSIIILTHNAAQHLDNCLSSFFETNTHKHVELIIIDHASTDETAEMVARHTSKGEIQYIRRDKNYTFSESCNFGAQQARYPYLLFMNDDIVYVKDVLPKAVAKLVVDQNVGAVGVRLDNVMRETERGGQAPGGKELGVQHLGIEFRWNEKRGYHQPEQIRHNSVKQYEFGILKAVSESQNVFPAVTGAFLLCRKADFDAIGGFSIDYDYGLEDIDFCLRLGAKLKRQCWCINELSLQHVEGATRKLGDWSLRHGKIERNHRIFKERWDKHIREFLLGNRAASFGGL